MLDTGQHVFYRFGTCRDPEWANLPCITGYISKDLVREYFQCASGVSEVTYFSARRNGIDCVSGYCNSTGIFCTNSDFFASGWFCQSEGNTGGNCTYNTGSVCPMDQSFAHYIFTRCDYGYYQSETLLPPAISTGAESNFNGYCYPCSGFKIESGNVITYPNPNGATSGNFYWHGVENEYGPTACRGGISGEYNDGKGFISLPNDCPYTK